MKTEYFSFVTWEANADTWKNTTSVASEKHYMQ